MEKVLVTGASGWIAQFCIVELIKQGYFVRGTLRSLNRDQEVKKAIGKEVDITNKLEFCKGDLLEDEGWDEAVKDCAYVLHVASPFIMENPKDADVLIKPAKEGTLRVLTAAKKAKVKRVVLTSSIAAMAAHVKQGSFDASSWTDLSVNYLSAYEQSKTIAEKAAWDFIHNQEAGHQLELSVINPGGVFGPTLSPDIQGVSLDIFAQMLTKKMPGIPDISFAMVDVRDVAYHHVKAMTVPEANGKRFISAHSEPTQMIQVARLLKKNGYDVPTKSLPSILIKFMGLFDKQAKGMSKYLGRRVSCDNSDTIKILEWKPISLDNAFLDMAKTVQEVLNSKN